MRTFYTPGEPLTVTVKLEGELAKRFAAFEKACMYPARAALARQALDDLITRGTASNDRIGQEYRLHLATINALEQQPSSGYAVSPYADRSFAKDAKDLQFADLARYVRDNKDALADPQNYVGAWHDPASDKIYLDISRVVGTHEEARELARLEILDPTPVMPAPEWRSPGAEAGGFDKPLP